jgi:hypothetical protein
MEDSSPYNSVIITTCVINIRKLVPLAMAVGFKNKAYTYGR